jgi:hypothetical protein
MTNDELKDWARDAPIIHSASQYAQQMIAVRAAILRLFDCLQASEQALNDQKAYTQDFMRQVRGLQAQLDEYRKQPAVPGAGAWAMPDPRQPLE